MQNVNITVLCMGINSTRNGVPAHTEALKNVHKGNYGRALEELETLPESADVLNDRAVCLHQLGRSREALPLLDEALRQNPQHGAAMLNRKYMKLAINARPAPSRHKVVEDWGPPSTSSPKVSVIIPTYDRPDFLREAVESVLGQTFRDFELVVVNDGGPEVSEKILNEIADERIRYVKIEHAGISSALNAGIAHARGSLLGYLDDDDVYYPEHLETLVNYMENNPQARMAYTLSHRSVQVETENGWKTESQTVFHPEPFDFERLREGNCIQTTGSIMHRRKVIDELHGFNENIIGCQDWDFHLRVNSKYPIHFIDSVTMDHRVRKKRNSQLTLNHMVMRKNHNIVLFLHGIVNVTSFNPRRVRYSKALSALGIHPNVCHMNEVSTSREAFLESFRLAPWEYKIYPKIFSPKRHRVR